MDPIKNPFSPGAGSPPPELVGRGEILTQSHILLARVKEKRPEKSFLLTGLRGVGKTVLLNEIERLAEKEGYKTVLIEAHEKKSLGVLLVPYIRRLLYDLDRIAGAGDKVRRGLGVLKSFINSIKIKVGEIEFGLGIDPEQGTADSGDLEVDLPSLFVALAEAAEERKTAVAILIDELQYFSINEISALIMAMHKIQQRQLPLVFVGAGLPILPALAGESKTYAERLFLFPNIGALSKTDAIKALQDPVKEVGVEFSKDALNEIFDVIVLLEPTSPLRTFEDIDDSLEKLVSSPNATSLVSVGKAEAQDSTLQFKLLSGDFLQLPKEKKAIIHYRRQDIKANYFLDGSIYISDIKILLAKRTFVHDQTIVNLLPKWKTIEIDDEYDYQMAIALGRLYLR